MTLNRYIIIWSAGFRANGEVQTSNGIFDFYTANSYRIKQKIKSEIKSQFRGKKITSVSSDWTVRRNNNG